MSQRLSDAAAKKLPFDGRSLCVYHDHLEPALALRIYPSGHRVWALQYTDPAGHRRFRTISPISELSLEDARYHARRILTKVSRLLSEFQGAPTLERFSQEWLDSYAKQHRKTWSDDLSRLQKYILPALGDVSLGSIKTRDLAALHSSISSHAPIQANRCVELVRAIYNKAIKWEVFTGRNPAEGVDRNKEHHRNRWVTPEEMPRLLAAIQTEDNPYVRAAILLYLLTGLRKSELLNSRWEDVDLERGVLRIPETKSGRPHQVELSHAALSILRGVTRCPRNPYIICGRKPGRPMVNIRKPWLRIRKEAGLDDVTLHDLRRTLGSWLATQGHSLHLIGQVLNHQNPKTTAIYAQLHRPQVREALEKHGEKLVRLLGIGA